MNHHSEGHLFEQIAESVRLQIARGELHNGDRLPSIRDMAHTWQCTPSTVNRAYAILGDEGLVASHRGGGTRVTANPLSHEDTPLRSAVLVNQIEALLLNLLSQGYSEEQAESAFAAALKRWHSLAQTASTSDRRETERQLRFVGSHDLTIGYLADELEKATDYRLKVAYRGSLGGLIALARGEADIAGSHLWDEQSNEYNVPYVRRVLPGRRVALVTVASRSFGLIVPRGNPQNITSLADLNGDGVRWVNRQPGSGTRVWLDAQLSKLGVNTAEINGYEDTRSTHLEVAGVVKEGTASAGLGIQAAAAAYDLDFIPCAQEQYQLVIPDEVFESAACQILLNALRTESFESAVEGFGGYDTTSTGEITWVN